MQHASAAAYRAEAAQHRQSAEYQELHGTASGAAMARATAAECENRAAMIEAQQ